MRRIKPTTQRCKLCGVPFTGIRGWINYTFKDIEPFSKNPNICNQ
jgi:hypothetical protein